MESLYVFDLDGTLADDKNRLEWVYDYGDETSILQDAPITNVLNWAKDVNRTDDVVYMTGRPLRLYNATWLWLLDKGLIHRVGNSGRGQLLCRPDWCKNGEDVTHWKTMETLKRAEHGTYASVVVVENKQKTIEAVKRAWKKYLPLLTCYLVTEQFEVRKASTEQAILRFASLVEEARRNLDAAGLFDSDSDYGGMLGNAVMRLVETWSQEGHSGFSAEMTLQLFDKVVRGQPLTSKYWDERRDELLQWAHDTDPSAQFDKDAFVQQCLGPRPREAFSSYESTRPRKNGLSDNDIINFKILMNRVAEPGWEKLLKRRWRSRSELLDAAIDWVPGRAKRKQFRRAIDELWEPAWGLRRT